MAVPIPPKFVSEAQKPDMKQYLFFAGNNIFLCNGRGIMGPNVRSLLLTIFLLTLLFAQYFLLCIWEIQNTPPYIYVPYFVVGLFFMISVIISFLLVTFSDPGIIPRKQVWEFPYYEKIRGPPPVTYLHCGFKKQKNWVSAQKKLFKEVIVNNKRVVFKYCYTCKLYRPPRASHCNTCNNCVEMFDHHCPWVGNCIGKRNYPFYLMFVSTLCLFAIFNLLSCIAQITYVVSITIIQNTGMWYDVLWSIVRNLPFSVIYFLYNIPLFVFVFSLMAYHSYLISTNQTTTEALRNKHARYERMGFSFREDSCLSNCRHRLLKKIPRSKLALRESIIDLQPQPILNRKIERPIDRVSLFLAKNNP
mmetsp:Transcript_3075/g.4520  ORF Transcript_3075/g.4520 Transcript_3075/m.4520 type:complete len:361 (+) Transcript_3075:134-1216(+)